MKKYIVTTTIFEPSEAVLKFDLMQDWELIVAGDLKTPKDYSLKRGMYLSPQEQEKLDKELSDLIGWNCIQRRNFALLMAVKLGADVVALIDDDNIPYDHWGENLLLGQETEVNYYETNQAVFDSIGATNYKNLWHRGFPIQLIKNRDYSNVKKKKVIPDIQADFWNGDPDVDAICRMEHAPECDFDKSCFPIASNQITPYNSQNTFISKRVFRNYCVMPHIGRMDDIWAAYHQQALDKEAIVVFTEPSVYQARNDHDLTKDFSGEVIGYENTLPLIHALKDNPACFSDFVPEKTYAAFKRYQKLVDEYMG